MPPVDPIQDDDEVSVASFEATRGDRNAAALSMLASLDKQCDCRCNRCLNQFATAELLCLAIDHRQHWLELHKLDQDKFLFDVLRDLCIQNGVVTEGQAQDMVRDASSRHVEQGPRPKRNRIWYTFLGQPVCRKGFFILWGIGFLRFQGLLDAIISGRRAPPMDGRYLSKKHTSHPDVRSWVTSYLTELYESEAETLPDGDMEDVEWMDDILQDTDPQLLELVDHKSGASKHDVRWLPPGSVFEYFKLFNTLFPEFQCTFRYFWAIWKEDWSHKLRFRARQHHAVCSVCTAHKLIIKQLGGDANQRNQQMLQLQQHRRAQFADRRVYWSIRAEALLGGCWIVLICDGMDQAKFAYPRCLDSMQSKMLEPCQRPRLHVNACLLHGRSTHVAISRADMPKSTNVTIELIAIALTRLASQGLDLSQCHIHLQLDNTSSCNKNVQLLRWCSFLTSMKTVKEIRVGFLRSGHTHEDPHM